AYIAITITARNALNISFVFSSFQLSKNSVLRLYTRREYTDSITYLENNAYNRWCSRVYQGSSINILLTVPLQEIPAVRLKLEKIYFGFKSYGLTPLIGSPGASDGDQCQINVACPSGTGWENERRSVAIIGGDGSTWSGVL